MKKIEYMSPEMEVVKLKSQLALLAGSNDGTGEEMPGTGDSEEL